jgi:hypothetical protein
LIKRRKSAGIFFSSSAGLRASPRFDARLRHASPRRVVGAHRDEAKRKLIRRYKSAAASLCQPGFAPAPGSTRVYGTPLLAAWWVRTAAKVHYVVR